MKTINPYINFNGNCEEAFNFYKSIFGGEFNYFSRFEEMPGDQPIPKELAKQVMHVGLPISKETVLMGSDTSENFGGKVSQGTNFSISIDFDSESEAKEVFEKLSEGGKVFMPLEKTFWGALFGMFVDKYGIQWMVNYEYNK